MGPWARTSGEGGGGRQWGRCFPRVAEISLPSAAAAALRSASPPPCYVFAGPAAVAAAALAGSVRLGPRAFSHWRKATAGGLARDWSAAGRPRTWHLIGHAGSGLGVDEGIGGCRDVSCSGSGDEEMTPLMPAWRGDSGRKPEALRRESESGSLACGLQKGALVIPEALSQLQDGGVQTPGL